MMRVVILLLTVFLVAPAKANTFTELVEKTLPGVCVVKIVQETVVVDSNRNYIEEYNDLLKKQKYSQDQKGSVGTCFVIKFNNTNYILTNRHVIDNTSNLYIQFYKDLKYYEAQVVASDERVDIAILKLKDDKKLAMITPLSWASSETIKKGEPVWAIGHPLGFEYSVTTGIVSNESFRRALNSSQELVQVDVAINQGNSGGPLLNMQGRVVGVNTMLISVGGSSGNIGINFSVSSRIAQYTAAELIKSGRVSRSKIGIFAVIDNKQGKIKVQEVQANSPAKLAGVMNNDVLLKLNEQYIIELDDLYFAMDFLKPGDKVNLFVEREGNILVLETSTVAIDN